MVDRFGTKFIYYEDKMIGLVNSIPDAGYTSIIQPAITQQGEWSAMVDVFYFLKEASPT